LLVRPPPPPAHAYSRLPLHSFFGLRRAPWSTPFPYTTLFRSVVSLIQIAMVAFMVQRDVEVDNITIKQDPLVRYPMANYLVNRRSEEHTSELQSRENLVCRLLLEKKKRPAHYSSHPLISRTQP